MLYRHSTDILMRGETMNKDYVKGLGTGIILTSAVIFIVFLLFPEKPATTALESSDTATVEQTENVAKEPESEHSKEQTKDSIVIGDGKKNREDKDQVTASTDVQPEDVPDKDVSETSDEEHTPENETVSEDEKETIPEDTEATAIAEVVVVVPEGYTSNGVGIILEEHGIIDDYKAFNNYCVQNKIDGKLRSGTYAFTPDTTFETIVKAMLP